MGGYPGAVTTFATVASYVVLAVQWAWTAAQLGALLVGLWALVDAILRPAEHFAAADKRTKTFWLVVNLVGVAVVVLMGASSMLGLMGVVANGVYLADVRPALDVFKTVRVRSRIRRSGRNGRDGGGPVTGWR